VALLRRAAQSAVSQRRLQRNILRRRRHLGMLGMRECIEMVHGAFAVQSAPGRGTTILVQIPLANGAPENAHS